MSQCDTLLFVPVQQFMTTFVHPTTTPLPSRNCAVSWGFVVAPFQFVMLDSVSMVGNSLVDGRDLPGSELPGPSDVAAAEDQWAWVGHRVI